MLDKPKASVYIETSIVSYLTARLSRDLILAANQQLTNEWWQAHREHFTLYISQLVLEEIRGGDPEAATQRLHAVADLPLLTLNEATLTFAEWLIREGPLPPKAAADALHIAIATMNGIDYLLTWNCKHLANAVIRRKIERLCLGAGYEPPNICTPQELLV